MAVKKRERVPHAKRRELDNFISEADPAQEPTPEPAAPAAPAAPSTPSPAPAKEPATTPQRTRSKSVVKEVPEWVQRAQTEKKTEGQPLRYNRSQAALLAHAKEIEGRDYSKILADLIWPVLEEKYGQEVPLQER